MRQVKKACVSSSAIPSWWSTQPSKVTLMLNVKSPMRRVLSHTSLADVLAPARVGRDDPPPDPGGAGLDRLLDRRVVRRPRVPRQPGAAGRARGHRLQLADAGLGLRGAARLRREAGGEPAERRGLV